MKIYTKTGDKGETGLFGGQRVSKASLRVECYGTVDELNSGIGVLRSMSLPADINEVLGNIQNQLFILGADLATPPEINKSNALRITPDHIKALEEAIDCFDARLEPIKNFIVPGGHPIAAWLHLIRSVSRRAERLIVRLTREETVNPDNLVYMNRLADLFFVLARYVNHQYHFNDVIWNGNV